MKKVFLIIFSLLFIASCATKIESNVKRPAEFDMSEVKSISVMPVEYNASNIDFTKQVDSLVGFLYDVFLDNSEEREANKIASLMESELKNVLLSTKYFDIVDLNPDVKIVGSINSLKSNVTTETYTNKEEDSTTKKTKEVTTKFYVKEATLEISFSIINAETHRLLDIFTYEFNEGDKKESKSSLKKESELFNNDIKYFAKSFANHIQPHSEIVSYKVLDIKPKSSESKLAKKLVKNKKYTDALILYSSIYEKNKIPEARYNEVVLNIVLGRFEEATFLLNDIKESNEITNLSLIKDIDNLSTVIEKEIKYKDMLEKQLKKLKNRKENFIEENIEENIIDAK